MILPGEMPNSELKGVLRRLSRQLMRESLASTREDFDACAAEWRARGYGPLPSPGRPRRRRTHRSPQPMTDQPLENQ